MTTADVLLGWKDFGAWLFGIEERLTALISPRSIADWVVDRVAWFRRGVRRWRGYPQGTRRAGRHEGGTSVWEYLHRVPLEELRYQWKPRGQHRESRGWRYSGTSSAWNLIERSVEYREWAAYWRDEVNRLMDDIQYMLDHPPLPAEVTVHGCQDCLCGQIAAIRQEALA